MSHTLRYLADENIHIEIIAFLLSKSIDTVSVFSLGLNAKSDKEILERAHQLGRIVLTHDADFGQIIFTEKVPFRGLIYLQPGHILPALTIQTLQHLLPLVGECVEPFIIVADNQNGKIKVRIRNNVLP